ncbi:MAG: PEP-CTERM sorting domain-containing protein [Verrucomicrobiota bacterium]
MVLSFLKRKFWLHAVIPPTRTLTVGTLINHEPLENSKHMKRTLLPLVAGSFAAALPAQAVLINMDFGKSPGIDGLGFGTGDSVVYTGAAAIGSAGDFWNSTDTEDNIFQSNLLDSTGAATTVDLTWSDELQSSVNSGAIEFGSTGHNALMEDYAFTNTDTATITISDLPANQDYTFYLYGVPDGGGQGTRFAVTGSNEGTQDVTVGAVNDDNGLATPEDYVIFTGNTGAGGQIVYTQTSFAGGFSGSNGFQLDVVPEPSVAMLGGLGLLGLLRRRR